MTNVESLFMCLCIFFGEMPIQVPFPFFNWEQSTFDCMDSVNYLEIRQRKGNRKRIYCCFPWNPLHEAGFFFFTSQVAWKKWGFCPTWYPVISLILQNNYYLPTSHKQKTTSLVKAPVIWKYAGAPEALLVGMGACTCLVQVLVPLLSSCVIWGKLSWFPLYTMAIFKMPALKKCLENKRESW